MRLSFMIMMSFFYMTLVKGICKPNTVLNQWIVTLRKVASSQPFNCVGSPLTKNIHNLFYVPLPRYAPKVDGSTQLFDSVLYIKT